MFVHLHPRACQPLPKEYCFRSWISFLNTFSYAASSCNKETLPAYNIRRLTTTVFRVTTQMGVNGAKFNVQSFAKILYRLGTEQGRRAEKP